MRQSFLLYIGLSVGLIAGSAHAKQTTAPLRPRPPPPSASQEPSRAFSEQAVTAHAGGDHAAALKLFLESVALRSSPLMRSFIAREHHELAQYNDARAAASSCLTELESAQLAERTRGEVRLSCLWFLADSLYQMKDLKGASTAAEECLTKARDDTDSRNRDAVFLDCEHLSRALEGIREQERAKLPPPGTILTPNNSVQPARPVYRSPLLWLGVGAAAAVALGIGLGVGLRQPADPSDIRNVSLGLRY